MIEDNGEPPNYIMVKLNMIVMVNNSWTCSNIMNLLNSNENATEWYMNKKKLIITLWAYYILQTNLITKNYKLVEIKQVGLEFNNTNIYTASN